MSNTTAKTATGSGTLVELSEIQVGGDGHDSQPLMGWERSDLTTMRDTKGAVTGRLVNVIRIMDGMEVLAIVGVNINGWDVAAVLPCPPYCNPDHLVTFVEAMSILSGN